jgi:hypothetical protein
MVKEGTSPLLATAVGGSTSEPQPSRVDNGWFADLSPKFDSLLMLEMMDVQMMGFPEGFVLATSFFETLHPPIRLKSALWSEILIKQTPSHTIRCGQCLSTIGEWKPKRNSGYTSNIRKHRQKCLGTARGDEHVDTSTEQVDKSSESTEQVDSTEQVGTTSTDQVDNSSSSTTAEQQQDESSTGQVHAILDFCNGMNIDIVDITDPAVSALLEAFGAKAAAALPTVEFVMAEAFDQWAVNLMERNDIGHLSICFDEDLGFLICLNSIDGSWKRRCTFVAANADPFVALKHAVALCFRVLINQVRF